MLIWENYMKYSYLCIAAVVLSFGLLMSGCGKKDVSVIIDEQPPVQETSATLSGAEETSGTDMVTTETEVSSVKTSANKYFIQDDAPLPINPCIAHGWLPLSRGLVGEMIMTRKNEIRLYRPADPNTSSGINYGEVFVSVPSDEMTTIPFKPRMYRNELIATLPKEITTLPVTLLFECHRIPEGSELLPYEIYELEQPRQAASSRKDTYAFKLREEMTEALAKLHDATERGDWFAIEISDRLLNDQASRFLDLTKGSLNAQQYEAAKLLHQNSGFIIECIKNDSKPDIKPLVKQFDTFLETLNSID